MRFKIRLFGPSLTNSKEVLVELNSILYFSKFKDVCFR
jgi:hypothetical protein